MSEHASPTVMTVANILRYLKDDRETGKTLSEICRAVGIPYSTGFNILKTLREAGFVEYDSGTKRHSLGWGLVELGGAAADRLGYLSLVRPYLRSFALQSGLTCVAAQRSGDRYVIVDNMDGSGDIRITAPVGNSYPICYGAQGKVFLAYMTESELPQYLLPGKLIAYTQHSITETPMLKEELARIRLAGWAASCEEVTPGLNCIAAPVHGPHDEIVLVISAIGFASQLTSSNIAALGLQLKGIANKCSAVIAGHGQPTATA